MDQVKELDVFFPLATGRELQSQVQCVWRTLVFFLQNIFWCQKIARKSVNFFCMGSGNADFLLVRIDRFAV